MKFTQPLEKTQLVKRYKRFLADVIHPEKGEMTVHCPNTGSMKNCWQPGWTAWILDSGNLKRKYLYTFVLAENEGGELIGVNTLYANEIVSDGIKAGQVKQLNDFVDLKREVKYGQENSRIDILLTDKQAQKTYIEVKSVTLLEGNSGQGYFPDAVTTRGQKHLRELIQCVEQGHRAVLFFMVQHTGIKSVAVAQHIDPDYAQLLKLALESGVEVLVYSAEISPQEIKLANQLKFIN